MKVNKWLKSVVLLLLPLVFLSACQAKPQQAKGLKIVTSFYPIYAMVKEVSGDINDVRMIQSGSGIHSFEPSVSDVKAIHDADVFVYHSHTLESWAGDLDANLKKSKVKVIEASKGMDLDRVRGLEDVEVTQGVDEATLYDPHTWNDPVKVAEEAQLIAKALSKVDQKNADSYQKNADKLSKEANTLVEKYKPKFKKVPSKYFVTQHTAFSYLAKRFGLQQLGIAGISPDQEPTSRQLAEIQKFVKQYKVKTIFIEKNTSSKIAETVAKSTGAKVKTLSPLEADPNNNLSYLENVEENLKILLKSLK
ncbi:metal ABC transporter solute-binding protein, Zn/Mn family [Streptococcus didelphis]|uniref:metal ABC transporter solute-binding protein, Zn/Mn family n=1 Tax=Streptococcus didelphis TaxID=102886 RepID=UPI00037A1073|nr:zinc ABC transporter substrate-binding protein [Streptococcus didelphis]